MSQQKLKARLINGKYYSYLQSSNYQYFLIDENNNFIIDGNGDFIIGTEISSKAYFNTFPDPVPPGPVGAEWDSGMLEYEGQS